MSHRFWHIFVSSISILLYTAARAKTRLYPRLHMPHGALGYGPYHRDRRKVIPEKHAFLGPKKSSHSRKTQQIE